MLTIRLTRVGKKNSPAYRVVVADKKRAVKRKFIEIIGNYNPILKPKTLVIDKERAIFWISRGAQPSDTVRNLMCDLEILPKKEKANIVYGKKLSKKAAKEDAEKKPEAPAPTPEEEAAPIADSKEEASAEAETIEATPEAEIAEKVDEPAEEIPVSENETETADDPKAEEKE